MTHTAWNRFGRILFTVAIAVAAMLAIQSQANAAVCKVKLEDVGTIIGKGATKNLAFEDAATKCFDKKEARAKRTSASLDEDTGLKIIDQCANVRCEG
jgi:hypothetical protein